MHQHTNFRVRCRGVIMHDGKLLVVKHRPEANYYALPGGHLDAGETVEECIVRELVEELGVTPVVGKLLYVHTFTDKTRGEAAELLFEILNGKDFLNHEGNNRTHAFELAEVRWVSSEETITLLPNVVGKDFAEGKLIHPEVRYTKG